MAAKEGRAAGAVAALPDRLSFKGKLSKKPWLLECLWGLRPVCDPHRPASILAKNRITRLRAHGRSPFQGVRDALNPRQTQKNFWKPKIYEPFSLPAQEVSAQHAIDSIAPSHDTIPPRRMPWEHGHARFTIPHPTGRNAFHSPHACFADLRHKPNPPALEKAFMVPKWFAWKF